ncbi:MAG: thioredoxin family protein [Cyclobacteriaceae bacterium]|nr:thioredoxin family protein [Cyclobacteriaceae bacterium]
MAVNVLTDENFTDELNNSEKVIVKYMAGWCGSCRLLGPKFKRLSNDELYSAIQFVEVDAEMNAEARKFAGVTNLPFIAIIHKGKILEAKPTSKEESIVEMLSKLSEL